MTSRPSSRCCKTCSSPDAHAPCYPRRVSTEQEPICPACGYLRTGLAPDAKCPECGADGLDTWVVVVGTPRVSLDAMLRNLSLGFAVLSIGFAVVSLVITLSVDRRAWYALIPQAVWSLAVSLTLIAIRATGRRFGLLADPQTLWCAHPNGISIRRGKSLEFVACRDITSIDATQSLFGGMTVLCLIRRRGSLKGMIGMTPYLYVRGTREDRASVVRSLKQTLGLG
jgi:hypothetical protein